MESLGILTAAGAALFWGSYIVPFKKSRSSNFMQFQTLMGIGIGLSGFIISLLLGFSLSLNMYGLLSGIVWGSANVISLQAVLNLGMARSIPVMSSLVIISSFLWGALIFNELPSGLLVGVAGLILIIFGVVVVSYSRDVQSQNAKKGFVAAVAAGLMFGSQLAPLKMGQVATKDFFFPVCLGIFVSSLAIFIFKKAQLKNEAIKESLFSGVIWNIGNLLSLISLSIIGLSRMGPISQLSTLIAVLWGLFYFKEVTNPRFKLQVLIGAIILLIGVITLSFA